jgi:hypothetical protein
MFANPADRRSRFRDWNRNRENASGGRPVFAVMTRNSAARTTRE